MDSKLRIACGQFTVSANVSHNFRVIQKLVRSAVAQNARVLFLPEASDYLSKNPQHSFKLSLTTKDLLLTPLSNELRRIYKASTSDDPDRGLFVSIGIHEPDVASGKTINKLLWLNNQGEVQYAYSKIHLFDVNIKNGPILRESNSVVPGTEVLPPFAVPGTGFQVGYQICYDIRFPELSLKLFKLGANVLTFPSAFTVKTGEAHWKNLGRTRAIDNQSYVVMAAQCGEHQLVDDDDDGEVTKRVSYGNSLIIDPWGEVIGEAKKYDEELTVDADGDYWEVVVADLDIDRVEAIRTNMPLLEHRRDDIF
ncbi:Carbon-nitrogen hydrolase [Yamadazyma tenuis]|uniref:Nitrilase superfamily member n=1 Tax=Candida tenuis (strain ATCC 10573 / BCRC 21748 / CBS 615 / JCM 9827 / NBRC 10315 / NRRL Y-1498 / VKM Y-70) TaxID=590646 RepID=G3B0U9_CANTC|nr:nitrilase superfamily member [Yamadazyma tenuis ATCC 10573]EGV64808.1 nitrilase superfamily member [Yamadazyma tenuis ATCC 10573]WEJ97603.1 Carbon-nitrogen hydrolase [Yamadazyma tenuis]